MTRNNLREHLSWVLSARAFSPLQSTRSLTGLLSTQQHEIVATAPIGSIGDGDHAEQAEQAHQFLRPAIPIKIQEGTTLADMAKLQSGSSLSTKPRLLSHSPHSFQSPKSNPVRLPGSSLHDEYNATFMPRENCMRVPF